ncbi:MAG: HEAT repeat domain-containing protein, partial [Gemmataceae bacterium]
NRGDENEEARSAREKVSYEIIQGTADSVKIKKRYQLVTDDKVKGKPRREMQGEGEQTFDPKQGVFRSQAISYELNLNDENITLTIPITVSYRLLSTEEGIAKLKQIEESRQKAAENLKKMQEPLQVTKDDLKGLLEQIKTTNKSQARAAIDKLARATPEGDKEEVCKALLQALQSGDHFTKISAAKALAVWGTSTAGSALLQEIKGKDVFVRKAALEAIGKLNLKEAPLAVAPLLIEHATRGDAVNALKAMGPMAEEAVLPYLDDRDAFVQMEACKVLEAIGTEKSIEKIRKYGVSGKPFAKDTSAKAIQAIQQRK